MALEIIRKVTCDVCKKEMSCIHEKESNITVVFTTDQTEGRSCKPYLQNNLLHICHSCEETIINGNVLYGRGAQGFNEYFFKVKINENDIKD